MRILFVCKSLPYSFKGGIQTHVWELTRHLLALGAEVTILTGGSLRRGVYREREDGREIVFLPYPPGRRLPFLQKSVEDIGFNVAAYAWLRRHAAEYDCVHVQGRSGCFYAAAKRPAHAPPVLTTFHRLLDVEYAYGGQATGPADAFVHERVMSFAERRAARRTDHAVAVSREMRRELLEVVPEGALAPVSILPNGVSEDFGTPVTDERDPWELVFVGRLERIKGVYHLLDAMRAVDERIRLTVIGDGPERRGLTRILAGDDGLRRRVRLLGDRDADAVRYHLQRAAALVLPSFHESQGIVLTEAGVCGRPVVGASAPGIDEVVVHGETGLLYPPGDTPSLALVIDHLFRNPEQAAAMGARGRRRALEVYNWRHIAADTMTLYRALLADAGRPIPPLPAPATSAAADVRDVKPALP